MKICPKCYARNYDNAEICFNCRTSLVNIPIVTNAGSQMQSYQQNPWSEQTMGQIPSQNMSQQIMQYNEPKGNNKQKKNTTVLILTIISSLLIITNVITLFLLITSNKNKTNNTSQSLQMTDIIGQNNDQTIAPIEYQNLQFGQKLAIQDIDIQIDTAEWADIIRPKNVTGDYKVTSDDPNEIHYYVVGSIRNNKGNEIDLSRSVLAYFEFNDKYSYKAKFYCVRENETEKYITHGSKLRPLEDAQLIIAVSVPNEIKDIFEHCVLTIGYNDDFGYIDYSPIFNELSGYSPTFEGLDHVYQLQIK